MPIAVVKTELARIQPLRTLFLQETNFQVRYDAVHARGWSDSYLILADDREIGYGSTYKYDGPYNQPERDTVFEFYVIPPLRPRAGAAFRELLAVSGVKYVECQSNDLLLAGMLFEHTRDINSQVVLFGVGGSTHLTYPGGVVRRRRDDDVIFKHASEPPGDFVLEADGEIIASGGFLLHYNPPFADIYMEVAPDHRRKGAGSFLVQEVIKECYLAGRVPAARTGWNNLASQATLRKAGLAMSGCMLLGEVKPA